MKKSTQAVRAGTRRDKNMGGLNTPLLSSSAIEYLDDSEVRYPRYFNTLNHDVVAEKMSALECAEAGLVTSSGMAAISAILFGLLGSGDHIVLTEGLYGGTHSLIVNELERFGISFSLAATDVSSIQAASGSDTRMIFVESPSNPLLTVVDLAAVAAFAKSCGIITVIDNTFASPILQNPLVHGFDLVMHSGTKYLGGHSDLCCGTVNGSAALIGKVRNHAVTYGGCLNAQDCSLLERSLKTLELRVDRQSSNAAIIAKRLHESEHIKHVYYPGLESHPGHEIAARQMLGFGGMLSFELAGGIDPVSYIRRLELVICAVSLGGVETTICQPVATSHQKVSEQERQRLGITAGLLRLSVGIEDAEDISADLLQAFNKDV
ncbi:MAG: PLP-dependent aspartate aminotransferase family protein [Xanthomonadales bacterium]|nr:PLP-dependent aspartate aminotransferase family protein [Xanthomonadales bacterium]